MDSECWSSYTRKGDDDNDALNCTHKTSSRFCIAPVNLPHGPAWKKAAHRNTLSCSVNIYWPIRLLWIINSNCAYRNCISLASYGRMYKLMPEFTQHWTASEWRRRTTTGWRKKWRIWKLDLKIFRHLHFFFQLCIFTPFFSDVRTLFIHSGSLWFSSLLFIFGLTN